MILSPPLTELGLPGLITALIRASRSTVWTLSRMAETSRLPESLRLLPGVLAPPGTLHPVRTGREERRRSPVCREERASPNQSTPTRAGACPFQGAEAGGLLSGISRG
ncbi:hypothetical protein KTAU_31000 [Thermogemmatispora aurantia]|nr:hypothetical protein KTAU_31000 [Thermogemmatispora aurantia]